MLPGLWPSLGTELTGSRAQGGSSPTLAPPQPSRPSGMLSRLLAPLRAHSGGAPRPSSAPAGSSGGVAMAAVASTVCVTEATAAGSTGIQFGYPQLEPKFTIGRLIGKGGNGMVREVQLASDGRTFACKTIPKVLRQESISEKKRQGHVEALKREIAVLARLKGSLNCVELEGVYEDSDNIHIVMELCKGGELLHAVGTRHYSERTVASYMRGVLRTIAQCHAHHILHRDIKPGNFMLLSEDERAPLKAIDFGLAVPYEPSELPLTNLGLEGTPWFMAPEVLSSQVGPASDVWSAGVMAAQLLTGRLPFDDHRNPSSPSVAAIWRSILLDGVDFSKPWWQDISPQARDFVSQLLNKDPSKRPSAKEALKHPFLAGDVSDRSKGKQLQRSIVARIQRYAAGSQLKRSVLQLMAAELLAQPSTPPPSKGGASTDENDVVVPGIGRVLDSIMHKLKLDEQEAVPTTQVAEALHNLGFQLKDTEVSRILAQLDPGRTGIVTRAAFAASQLDWRAIQADHSRWLELARKVFMSLDRDQDGTLQLDELLDHLRTKLPSDEDIRLAVLQAMEEAGKAGSDQGLDFTAFMDMLRMKSIDSLDMYDERLGSTWSGTSLDRLNSVLQRSPSNSMHHNFSQRGPVGSLGSASGIGSVRGDASGSSKHWSVHRTEHGGSRKGAPVVWHFDVGPGASPAQPQPLSKEAASANKISEFRFELAGRVTSPSSTQSPAGGGMQWRFDVGTGFGSSEPANPAGASVVGGAVQTGSTTDVLPGLGLLRNGGGVDRRHHNSHLYMSLVRSGLTTVQESRE